jgi:hypothetical protein
MANPLYAYLVLKMPGPCGVISMKGDIKRAYDCDREICEMADRLIASAELQELKESLVESPPPRPSHTQLQHLQNIHTARGRTQQTDTIVYRGAFQGCSHRQHIGSQIGTRAPQIPPGNRDIFAWKPADMS